MGKLKASASVLAIVLSTSAWAQQQPSTVTNMPFASTPLDGTELLYVVQKGNPRKTTVGSVLAALPLNFSTITVGGKGGTIWSDWPLANPGPYYDSYLRDRMFFGYGTNASTAFATQNLIQPPGTGYLEREATNIVASPAGLGGTYDLCVASLANGTITPAYFSVSGATITSSSDGDPTKSPWNGVQWIVASGLGNSQTANISLNADGSVHNGGVTWLARPGNSFVIGNVLTAVHVAGLPTTLTATVTNVQVPFCVGHMAAAMNNAPAPYGYSADAEYWEAYRSATAGDVNGAEIDIGNGGDFQPISPYPVAANYAAGQTRALHLGSGGSENGRADAGSVYTSPISLFIDTNTNGGRGALKGFVYSLNSLYFNTTPLYNGATLSVSDSSAGGSWGTKSSGTGGVNGTAIYSIVGGVCSSQPTANFTWTAGVLTFNSVANPGVCTQLPQNFASLAYVSGTASGWTGATVRYVPSESALGLIAEAYTYDMRLAWFSSNGRGADGSANYGYVGAYIDSHVTDTTSVDGIDFTNNGTFISNGLVVTPQAATRGLVTLGTTAPFFQVQGGILTSAVKVADGSGGIDGSAIYAASGGTCTAQPTFNVTWAAGVLTINSTSSSGSCSAPPSNPAPLVYSSGGATGWTGATVNVSSVTNNTQMLHVANGNPGDAAGATQFIINNSADPLVHTTPSTNADSYNINLWASDGAAYQKAVTVKWGVAGSVGAGHVPGRWEVWTADASGTLQQALVVQSNQKVVIPGSLGVTALPTSASTGGLFVCVDSAGTFYKKSSCP